MNLETLLRDQKKAVLKKWIDLIIESYPDNARRFLSKEKDLFSNPVGSTISQEIERVYEALLKGDEREALSSSLDGILKIRAVQNFKPSEAVAFVFQLKDVIREELAGSIPTNGISQQLIAFEKQIDDTALLAFDIYSNCRRKIYDLRVNEIKRQVSRLLQRANLVCEIPDLDSGLDDDETDRVS
jgi:hypothetical protein